jgi:phytoene synthase
VKAGVIENISPLAADLRSNSPDCYLATLFAPIDERRSLSALYALDYELARIQRIVHEPMAGLIRLQWWDDVIDGFERGSCVAHPVVAELHHAVTAGGLDMGYLKRAIDARRRPFEEDRPPNLVSFEHYLIEVGGSVTSAAAALLGIRDNALLSVAHNVGAARATLEQLHILEQTGPDQRPWLPSVLLNQLESEPHGLLNADISRDFLASNQLAKLGLAQLAKGRAAKAPIKRDQLAAFFPATLAGVRLKNHLHASKRETRSNGALTLSLSWLRGRF